MSKNIQRLGETLSKRMLKTANAAVSVSTELGTINEDLSMTPDSLPVTIPAGEYMMMPGVRPQANDRVLVAWCGNDPVITGPASEQQEPLAITVTSDGQGNVTITF